MHNPTLTRAFLAGGTIKARRIVQIGTADGAVIQADADSDTTIAERPIGISSEVNTASGATVDVHLAGIALCVAGGAVTRGASVKADASGKAVATETGNDFVVGIALTSAAADGDIIPVLIAPQRIYMMARAFTAGGPIAARRIVQIGTADGAVIQADASSDTTIAERPIGISSEVNTASGATVDVHLAGTALCEAGGAVARGASLKADADGKAVATTTAKDFVVGIALTAGADGAIIQVLVAPQRI